MKNYQTLEILTPRLILRVPRMEDAVEINTAMQPVWPELQRWMSWAYEGENTLEATHRYIAGLIGAAGLIGVCQTSGRYVISTGLPGGDNVYQTGYWVAKEFLGKGYATEATNACIRYAFDALGATKIEINYYEDNEKSRRVIEKLGFRKLRTHIKSKARCLDGVLLDVHEYEMTDPSVLPPLDVTRRHRCP